MQFRCQLASILAAQTNQNRVLEASCLGESWEQLGNVLGPFGTKKLALELLVPLDAEIPECLSQV